MSPPLGGPYSVSPYETFHGELRGATARTTYIPGRHVDGESRQAVHLITRSISWSSCGTRRAEQVPAVSFTIEEYCHRPVRLDARWPHEFDACGLQAHVDSIEIVYAKEEDNSARELPADGSYLDLAISMGQENPGLAAWWSHDDPSFWASVSRGGCRILDELESEHVDEELNCRIVLAYEERNELEPRHHARSARASQRLRNCSRIAPRMTRATAPDTPK